MPTHLCNLNVRDWAFKLAKFCRNLAGEWSRVNSDEQWWAVSSRWMWTTVLSLRCLVCIRFGGLCTYGLCLRIAYLLVLFCTYWAKLEEAMWVLGYDLDRVSPCFCHRLVYLSFHFSISKDEDCSWLETVEVWLINQVIGKNPVWPLRSLRVS